MGKFIDPKLLGEVSRASNGPDLSFNIRSLAGKSGWTFATFDNRASRSFNWSAVEPGTRLRNASLPWLALLILLMSSLAAIVLDRARKSSRELIASETKALHLASRDPLTGLPNRRALTALLVDLGRRNRSYSIILLDLDGFKRINDTFGHGVGDKLLCRTADRLKLVLSAGAFLARQGGDEFAIVIEGDTSRAGLGAIAARLIAAIGEPYEFGGKPTTVGVSVGTATGEQGSSDDAVRHADVAMYIAKKRGRNGWQHYEPSLEDGRKERSEIEAELKHVLAEGQISLVYQPIVSAQSGRIVTVEALARWTHPTKGPISPDVFIPIAEESGLIIELGQHILSLACEAARDWPFNLAVNLSPAQFWDRDLVAHVMKTLERLNFPASRLEFEITENYLLRRPDAADAIIKDLRRRGIRVALDDFGTGYASIGYLRRFDFDLVKVDQSLIAALGRDAAAEEVLAAIISLCRALRLPILAEGVETEDQAQLLKASGCIYLQGWHFGRPMLAEQIIPFYQRDSGDGHDGNRQVHAPIRTGEPSSVAPDSQTANLATKRMQPWEAAWSGSAPA